jgi:hypothetical protein
MLPLGKYSWWEEATDVLSSTKVAHVPYRNHEASCEKLWFVRSFCHNLPQMGHFFTTSWLCPFHDTMPSFMNFRGDLDLKESKNKFLNVCGQATMPRCLKFIPISCIGSKHAPKDTYMIFQSILVHLSMCLQFKFDLCILNA